MSARCSLAADSELRPDHVAQTICVERADMNFKDFSSGIDQQGRGKRSRATRSKHLASDIPTPRIGHAGCSHDGHRVFRSVLHRDAVEANAPIQFLRDDLKGGHLPDAGRAVGLEEVDHDWAPVKLVFDRDT